MQPPKAKKIPAELEIHGDIRIDNYYWMNDREDPEVIAYLNAEMIIKTNKRPIPKNFRYVYSRK